MSVLQRIGMMVVLIGGVGVVDLYGELITFTNLNLDRNNAWAMTDSNGHFLGNGQAALRLGISDLPPGQITSNFRRGNLDVIDDAFIQFAETVAIGDGDLGEGVWQVPLGQSTKASQNNMGGMHIDVWAVIGGDFLSTSAEHLYVRLKQKFQTDPEIGASLAGVATFSPANIQNTMVGHVDRHRHDFGVGETEAFSTEAIPEPTTALLVGAAVVWLGTLRLRRAVA